MKKIFAKELAALAVLALAFTGCNTAFDGTNANFSEKESVYTDRSGATQTVNDAGTVTVAGTLSATNTRNEITVTVTSFSKINLNSADDAIKFQRLTKNATNDAYWPTRSAEQLTKKRVKASEYQGTTTITYEVDGTSIAEDRVACFVDATKLKTKGGTPVLAGDGNLKRGEESDNLVIYTNGTTFRIDGVTSPTSTGTGEENFCPYYNPIGTVVNSSYALTDTSNKSTGVIRIQIGAKNKKNTVATGAADDWESGLAAKFNEAVILQYREPGKREYETKNLSFTYHDAASTAAYNSDPYEAHAYTADFGPLAVGTEWRLIQTKPEGIVAPTWYKEVYGHDASYYYGNRAGAKSQLNSGTYTLHKDVPGYIVVNATLAKTGSALTYDAYSPYSKNAIKTAQTSYFSVKYQDNWIKVIPSADKLLDKAAASDFIVVDANNKKVASKAEVYFKSYKTGDADFANNGEVDYIKITLEDVRYRNYTSASSGEVTSNPGTLKVLVGPGTKIQENKVYGDQKAFGQWKDVADDDASGYVQIN